jgi:hypothetical protein
VDAGHEIVLLMDANSPLHDPVLEAFINSTFLHKLINVYLPATPPPTTYQRGRHKIDYIWGTPAVLTATHNAIILPLGTGPKTDHAILYTDICLSTLSGLMSDAIHDPTHPASHNLWSTDIKAATKYVELVCQAFLAENISERIAILWNHCQRTDQCTNNDVHILNKIDRDITAALLKAERECKRAKGHAWSPLLAKAGHTVIATKWHL